MYFVRRDGNAAKKSGQKLWMDSGKHFCQPEIRKILFREMGILT